MQLEEIRIKAYDLSTPKYIESKNYVQWRYDHEQIEVFLYLLTQLPDKERRLLHKGHMLSLKSYNDSFDSDFVEGVFLTARYGKQQDIIDVIEYKITGQKGKNEGGLNEVVFLLDKRSGLLLVQNDDEHVINREMLQRFFKSKMPFVENYIKQFNTVNKPMTIPRNAYASISIVDSKDFFEEIKELSTIKEVYFYADINDSVNNIAIKYLDTEAKNNKLKNYQKVKISLINNVRKSSIKHVESYIRTLMELQQYDTFGVIGSTETRRKQIDFASKFASMSYLVPVHVNENGLINTSELIDEMVRIAKFENPIEEKMQHFKSAKKVYGDVHEFKLEVAASENGDRE